MAILAIITFWQTLKNLKLHTGTNSLNFDVKKKLEYKKKTRKICKVKLQRSRTIVKFAYYDLIPPEKHTNLK